MTPEHSRKRSAEDARASILAAARARFGQAGFEGATIRAIAADAGYDPALVMRYFGSKEQLFAVSIDYDLEIFDLSAMPREQVGEAIVRGYLGQWEGPDGADRRILLRAAVTHPAARAQLEKRLTEQVVGPLIGALNPTESHERHEQRAALLATQMLGLALCRYMLKLPSVTGLSVDQLVRWITPTVDRYLVGELPDV